MSYAEAYRLAYLLETVLAAVYVNDQGGPCELDEADVAAIHEAHGIALRACTAKAAVYVAGANPVPETVDQARPKRGAKRKRQPVIQEDACPRCKRTGQPFYVRASGQRTAYCVECS